MEALGATVIRTPSADLMVGAIERAKQITARTPGAYMPNQFSNPVNPLAHYETTGPEIAEALGGSMDAFVAGVGTTGTFIGVARFLHERAPEPPASRRRAAGLDPRRRREGAARGRGHRPLLLPRDPRPRPDRRGRHDHGRGGLRDLPAPRPRGRSPRRRLLGSRRGGGAQDRAAPRAGQDRGDALPGRRGAVPGAGDLWRIGCDWVIG